MKRTIFGIFGILMFCLAIISCEGTNKNPVIEKKADSTAVSQMTLSMVDHVISVDRQDMYTVHGGDYRWFETCVEFDNYFDEESNQNIHSIVNIFQVIVEKDKGADVTVYAYTHLADTMAVYPKMGFWIEDWPMEEEKFNLNWAEAYDRMMQANCPKPHSRQACLRKPIGPRVCNPQYIFGNLHSQVWVDAVTGEVKNSNPAFPEVDGFKMPLGEWP